MEEVVFDESIYKKLKEYRDRAVISLRKNWNLFENSDQTVEYVFPIWVRFIENEEGIKKQDREVFKGLGTGDERIEFINKKYPHFCYEGFWAIALKTTILQMQREN